MPPVYNERSWAIDLISEINQLAPTIMGPIKRAGGEWTVSNMVSNLFPDVLLFGDADSQITLQGWELKMPDTPINDAELLQNASAKAKALGVNSFVVWNVTHACLYVKDGTDAFVPHRTWNNITEILARDEVASRKTEWVAGLRMILTELNEYLQQGVIRGRTIVETLSDYSLAELILSHAHEVERKIQDVLRRDSRLDADVTQWWATIRTEYPPHSSAYHVLAQINLVNWINKIVFAHVLKSSFSPAAKVEQIGQTASPEQALSIFEEISNQCNFLNIFKSSIGEHILPDNAWNTLKQFNIFLSQFSFGRIAPDLLQSLLQQTVSIARRKISGQYTTPATLSNLLIRLVMLNKEKDFYDPFCGTGTIARAAYDVKLEYGMTPQSSLSTIWASDKFLFPLQLCTMALVTPGSMGCPLRIFKKDIVDSSPDMEVTVTDPQTGRSVTEQFRKVDYIGANLPFVKQEDLDEINPKIREISAWICQLLNSGGENDLDGKSDLYAYIPFWLWPLLTDSGRVGIITSNAWLGTKWGAVFRKVLKKFFDVETVAISGNGRWFQNAQVVTTLLILRKRRDATSSPDDYQTRFCTTLIPIEALDTNIKRKELAVAISTGQPDSSTISIISYSQMEIHDFERMGMEWSSFFADVRFMKSFADKMVSVSDYFQIPRGERRGWNQLFYPEGEHGIEPEYLHPVLRSFRGVETLVANTDSDAFCCHRTLEELEALSHIGALNWIRRFESATNEIGKPLTESLKRAKLHWYEMKDSTTGNFVISMNPDQRLFIARFQTPAFVDQRLIPFRAKDGSIDLDLCHALFNSVLGISYIEAMGFGRGLGVLDLSATKLKTHMRMLNPNLLNEAQRTQILDAFSSLLRRPVLPVLEELEDPDRKRFDEVVLRAYGVYDHYQSILKAIKGLYKIRKAVKPN